MHAYSTIIPTYLPIWFLTFLTAFAWSLPAKCAGVGIDSILCTGAILYTIGSLTIGGSVVILAYFLAPSRRHEMDISISEGIIGSRSCWLECHDITKERTHVIRARSATKTDYNTLRIRTGMIAFMMTEFDDEEDMQKIILAINRKK